MKVDWKKIAVDDLRNYTCLQQSVESIPLQVSALEEDFQTIKGSMGKAEPVTGGRQGVAEDILLSNICRRERLGHNLTAICRLLAAIEDGLSVLSKTERLTLERFFINRSDDYLDRLHEELGYEVAQIYRLKDVALRKFTLAMYGVVDL